MKGWDLSQTLKSLETLNYQGILAMPGAKSLPTQPIKILGPIWR